jgi:hypothetical protein
MTSVPHALRRSTQVLEVLPMIIEFHFNGIGRQKRCTNGDAGQREIAMPAGRHTNPDG